MAEKEDAKAYPDADSTRADLLASVQARFEAIKDIVSAGELFLISLIPALNSDDLGIHQKVGVILKTLQRVRTGRRRGRRRRKRKMRGEEEEGKKEGKKGGKKGE